jgi:hypothetical protein
MRPHLAAVAALSCLALASLVAADPRFPAPASFTVANDPEELAGTKLLAKWSRPVEPPPAGWQLAGYRLATTHPGRPYAVEELVESDIVDAVQLLCDAAKTEAGIESLDPRHDHRVTLEAAYVPVGRKLVCSASAPSEPSAEVNARFSNPVVVERARPIGAFFDPKRTSVLLGVVLFGLIVVLTWKLARTKDFYIRPIPGMRAVDDAIGRATEMGRPLLYISGLGSVGTISTIAAMLILGHLARRTAAYGTPILAPCTDPLVMSTEREIVREAYIEAGRPEAFRPDDIFFITDSQFGYVSAVDGIIMRERPAANFFMGSFFAESLILAETGNMAGSVQIAGTDSDTQLPFFITSCDYTLMGEELYAAGAYLSRHPLLVAQLKGQDIGKSVLAGLLAFGVIFASFAAFGIGKAAFELFMNSLVGK